MKSNLLAQRRVLLFAALCVAFNGSTAFAQSNIPDLAQLKLAAEAGDARAQFEYGSKIGFSNPEASFAMILKSAAQGYEPAEERAGSLLLQRATFNKERAKLERMGVRFTIRAAFKGNLHAQQRLSDCYREGTALTKSPVLAYAWTAIALRTAGGPKDYHAQAYKAELDFMISRMPSHAIAEGQRIADNFQLTKEAEAAIEAELVVAQLRLAAIYLGGGRKAAVVNQTRFGEGETKTIPLDGEPVVLACTAIDAKSATFKLGTYAFTLTSK